MNPAAGKVYAVNASNITGKWGNSPLVSFRMMLKGHTIVLLKSL